MQEKKKVVHITTVHHPFDTRIYHKECLSLHYAGYEVILIAPEHSDLKNKKTEIDIQSIKKHSNKYLRMISSTVRAYKKARKLRSNYYHIHDPELLPVAWLLKKKNNVVIYDIHEDYVTSIMQKDYIPKYIRKLVATVYKMAEKMFIRKLELCLAEKYYKDIYGRGKCILNYPKLNGSLTDVQAQKPIEDKLLYTGNVLPDRGATIHARIPNIDQRVEVYVYGLCPKSLAEKMYEIAGERKAQLVIEGVDHFVPRETIDDAYVSRGWLAGLALFPPTNHYFNKELTKFFEYMSAGIPIICSNFPVWRAFIDNYSCGIAVDPYDDLAIKQAIQYLRSHPQEARKMGENGREAVFAELNWSMEEKKLIQWYKTLVKNRS